MFTFEKKYKYLYSFKSVEHESEMMPKEVKQNKAVGYSNSLKNEQIFMQTAFL
jgi:hypothetical protein